MSIVEIRKLRWIRRNTRKYKIKNDAIHSNVKMTNMQNKITMAWPCAQD